MKRVDSEILRLIIPTIVAFYSFIGGGIAHAADGDLVWAKALGSSSGSGVGYGVAVDSSGNVYTTGYYEGTVDFDPGPGTFTLPMAVLQDMFISKLDVNGNFVWAKAISGVSSEQGNSIAVDELGNVYTTGYFDGTTDFDPGAGIVNLTSAGGYDAFLSKLDVNGNFVWAKALSGTGYDYGSSIAVDLLGNVYTTGYFQGTTDFDPGASTFNLTVAAGISYEIFVSKLDLNGNFVWAKAMGGSGTDRGNSIAVDTSGNIYTCGYFAGNGDFDPSGAIFTLNPGGGFVSKLDTNGNFIWATQQGGAGGVASSIAIDTSENVYITGTFVNTVDFDQSAGTFNLTAVNGQDVFISKLAANGTFLWAGAMGGMSTDNGLSVAVDAFGNVYTTGKYEQTVDFDPSAGIFNLTSAGYNDIFVSKLDTNGGLVWANTVGGTSFDQGHAVAVDGFGAAHITGYFNGTADFDPGVGVFNLTSPGGNNIFVTKLSGPPQPPGSFTLSSVTSVCNGGSPGNKLTWTPSAGATSYVIYRNDVAIYSGLTGTTYTNNNVIAGTTYSYKVRANNAIGITFTNSVSKLTGVCPGTFTLSSVTSVCNGGSPGNKLTWTASPGATSYHVFRDGVAIYSGLTGTTYTNYNNVTAGTTYTYKVRANNAIGNTFSNSVSILAATCPGTFTLSSVTSVCNGTKSGNQLTWTASPGATSYHVFRDGVAIYSGLTGTTYTNNNGTAGTTYSYKVRANNAIGNTFSNSVSKLTGTCP